MYVSFFAININYSVINTKNKKMCCSCFGLELLISLEQGAKKVSFTACHLSKLYLACTSPFEVISTRRKLKYFDEQ